MRGRMPALNTALNYDLIAFQPSNCFDVFWESKLGLFLVRSRFCNRFLIKSVLKRVRVLYVVFRVAQRLYDKNILSVLVITLAQSNYTNAAINEAYISYKRKRSSSSFASYSTTYKFVNKNITKQIRCSGPNVIKALVMRIGNKQTHKHPDQRQ